MGSGRSAGSPGSCSRWRTGPRLTHLTLGAMPRRLGVSGLGDASLGLGHQSGRIGRGAPDPHAAVRHRRPHRRLRRAAARDRPARPVGLQPVCGRDGRDRGRRIPHPGRRGRAASSSTDRRSSRRSSCPRSSSGCTRSSTAGAPARRRGDRPGDLVGRGGIGTRGAWVACSPSWRCSCCPTPGPSRVAAIAPAPSSSSRRISCRASPT